MTLSAGSRLGPYEILSPLGAGGMGEVYRAKDTRLGRDVAIKVLPAELSSDASRLKRFEKEARSASALNHPNIVTIYDIGSSGEVSYIAMELVEGETLGTMLLRGSLATRRLLQIATQVAEGLAKAHEAGIVHRDLKPENVMVAKDGLVKILDFGVAKPTFKGSGSYEGAQAPTLTETSPGVILGTVGYMSPEQARAEPLDFRSDQFALGSMLYEMATGKRAFQKKTSIDTLAAILNEQPEPIAAVNLEIPAPLRWIVERCLAKEPRNRYASTEDLAGDLATVRDHLGEATSGIALAVSGPRRRWVPVAVLGVAALAIAAVSLLRPRPPTAQLHTIRFSLGAPPDGGFGDGYQSFAFSPDGSQIAFLSAGKIWLRPLSAPEARAMPGTDGADSPFWSPDGRSVGFFAGSKLWRVDLSGGAPVPLCDTEGLQYAGTWGADGQILFAPMRGEAIYRVSASGGKPAAILKPDRARGETTVTWPWFLPDGKSFLYHVRQGGSAGSLMFSPPSGPARPLFPMVSRVEYVDPGYVVFVREGTLISQRFDPRTGRVSGEPFSIADSVAGYFLSTGQADFATSRSGALAFVQNLSAPGAHMSWLDRSGKLVETLSPIGSLGWIAIDRDGRRVLFERREPKTQTRDLWIFDLERKVETRVTSDPTDEFHGVWLPDGKSIVYTAESGGLLQLRRRELATGREVVLVAEGQSLQAEDGMPEGAQLAYMIRGDRGDTNVRLVSLGDRKSSPLLQTAFDDREVRFSPDGRYIVFLSDESGGNEAYVAPVAAAGEKTRISSGGIERGTGLVRWSRDGKEIFYFSGAQLMSVPVRTAPSLSLGQPSPLFSVKEGTVLAGFDVSPDGKRFLTVAEEPLPEKPPLHVVLNWTVEAPR